MPAHPLVPLDAEEFGRNLEVLRGSGRLAPSMRFAGVVLAEPPKADVLAWRPVTTFPAARARSSGTAPTAGRTTSSSTSWPGVEHFEHLPGVTPNFTLDEFHEAEEALKREPRVVEALAARGMTDLDLVLLDTWTFGAAVMPEQWRDRRSAGSTCGGGRPPAAALTPTRSAA